MWRAGAGRLYAIISHRIAQDSAAAGIDRLGAAMLIALATMATMATITPPGFSGALPAMKEPLLILVILADIGVGVCSSVIPYVCVCDQLAMARLPQATFALLLSLLPASTTIIGVVVLRQIPRFPVPWRSWGILLVTGGEALHREVETRPGKQTRTKATAQERRS